MASVEDRIVKIQFDNASFQRRLADTLTSIQKLNTSLATAGSRNGLSNIADSTRNFNLSGIGASIDGISKKFLALSTIALTVLSNITTKALASGAQLAKALTLDPVISGFREYELGIGSIQTILANTSADNTNLEQVNAALDELNEYSDKTIYNFGEMTRNIGTFTAAGVDLDTSVMSIKGIANVAAISGSNSEQAASAMYQLSQAVSNGSVKLLDWNSVVNAGMGGEVFQKALFETGKAMGTIADTPIDMTFEEWTDAGNSFRTSLEDGWLTADVLTTTLSGFTGEMTEAQLTALGYTQEQAKEMMRLGQLGVDSATKVRTLTQLINTSKEALQSGWAQSFELIFGDFEEATELFTGLSDAIGASIGSSADARNALLQGWRDLGGREKLIEGLSQAFRSLSTILGPIRRAFRYIFPPMTAERLFKLTEGFDNLMKALYPAPETVKSLFNIFAGFFSVLEIGWTVIKEGVGFIIDLVRSLTGLGSGNFLGKLGELGSWFTDLNRKLVGGGGIAAFFDGLSVSLEKPIAFVNRLKESFSDFFSGLKIPSGFAEVFNTITGLFGGLSDAGGGLSGIGSSLSGGAGGVWGPLKTAFGTLGDILDSAWNALVDFFGNLGSKLAEVIKAPDFDTVLEIIDSALLGGILALLYKLFKGGLFSSLGGDILKNISGAFGELTGVLQAMQTDLRANALMKIAIAIGILAVSLLLLSTIEPQKLSDALASMAIAFGQLIGAFAIINKLSINFAAAGTLALIATGMVIMAGAVLLLVASIKLLSMMEWEELAKGLAGVGASLALLTGAATALSFAKGSMIGSGIGMLFIASALIIMAGAVKLFSMMEWDEMIKGLTGVAGALIAIAIGVKFMGKSIILIGPGLVAVGAALLLISGAMKAMSTLSWEEIAKGIVAIGGALGAIAIATSFMSPLLPVVGVGLIAVGAGLSVIAGVMKILSTMSWEGIGKGLAGIGGALLVIATAMVIANSGVLGAAGLIGMAFGLTILVGVLTTMSALSWGQIIKGVAGIAIALGTLAIVAALMSPAVGPLLAVGAALLLIGAGFALFGVGVASVAKGFEILARVGEAGVETIIAAFTGLAKALPEFLEDVSKGVLSFLETLMKGMPEVIEQLVEVVSSLLDGLITLIPKAVTAISTLITNLLSMIRARFPELVETGFEMITALLTGLRDNVGPIAILVSEILINFMDALALQIPALIDSFYNLLVAVIQGVIAKAADIGQTLAPKGRELLDGLLKGAKEFFTGTVLPWLGSLPSLIVTGIGLGLGLLVSLGKDIISGLRDGAVTMWESVKTWFSERPQALKNFFTGALTLLKNIGINIVSGLYNGWLAGWNAVKNWMKDRPKAVKDFFVGALNLLKTIGSNIISGLYNGWLAGWNAVKNWMKDRPKAIKDFFVGALNLLKSIGHTIINGLYNGWLAGWNAVKNWMRDRPKAIQAFFSNALTLLKNIGHTMINGLYNGWLAGWNAVKGWLGNIGQGIRTAIGGLRGLLSDIGANIMNSLKNGAANVFETVKQWFIDKAEAIKNAVLNFFGIGSPSKVFMWIGEMVMTGMQRGLEDEWDHVSRWLSHINPADHMQDNLAMKMNNVISGVARQLEDMDEFHPTITPVLDLTQVQNGAAALAGMLPANTSYLQAANIARSTRPGADQPETIVPAQGDVKFEQNIYAPKQLSTGEIYRQTRNQIAIAKEELNIA